MDHVSHHQYLPNLFSDSRIAPGEADLELSDLEMVLNRNGDFLRPPRLRMARQPPRLHNREKFHAARKSSVFRLRPPQELPELRLAWAGSNRVDDNVPGRSPQQQGSTEGVPIPDRRPNRRHRVAAQDPPREGPRLVVPRRDVLRSDEGERVQPLHTGDAVRTGAGGGREREAAEPAAEDADGEVAASAVERGRRRADSVEIEEAGILQEDRYGEAEEAEYAGESVGVEREEIGELCEIVGTVDDLEDGG